MFDLSCGRVALFLIGFFWATPPGTVFATDQRPNVIVILTDDQGWGDLSLHGNTNLRTSHIDSLATDGARFENFFVCPVCAPTRAEFLTGRYHPRGGVNGVTTGAERLDLDEVTIADVFRAAGYATAAFGKWHNGSQYPYHPNGRGFDEFYGFCSGHWGDYFSPPLEHNGQLVRGNGYISDDFTNRAMTFMEQHADQPFFAYLAYNTPHSPMQVPDRWWNAARDRVVAMRPGNCERENMQHTRAALAMCENIDWNVGRLLAKLDALQIEDNTVLLFLCDNGPNGVRWNGGMRGIKGSTDEGGVRSPLLVRWPRKIRPGTVVPQIAGAIDLLPTLADLAGIEVAGQPTLDGKSLKSLLLQESTRWPDRFLVSHWNRRVSVRSQRYRIDHAGRLYDMVRDPGQSRDVAQQFPQVADEMRQVAHDWQTELLTGLGEDDRPFSVGHRDFVHTHLPARDAVPHGNIQRSSRHPNCSFLTNWTSHEDRITWDVEVLTSGNYDASIYYTCRPADVGAVLELDFAGNRVQSAVTDAHDPPLDGGQHDRVPRSESFVKDFRELSLGTIRLENSRAPLTLRAIEIPGEQAIDFRLLTLTRRTDQ